jgi:hypothetical protein
MSTDSSTMRKTPKVLGQLIRESQAESTKQFYKGPPTEVPKQKGHSLGGIANEKETFVVI